MVTTYILIGMLVVQTLSAAANAMSMEDRSFYGWLYRFGRIWTNSLLQFTHELRFPTLPSAPSAQPDQTTTPNSK